MHLNQARELHRFWWPRYFQKKWGEKQDATHCQIARTTGVQLKKCNDSPEEHFMAELF
jgi:hypothetical protein